jgi:hypothetical protein
MILEKCVAIFLATNAKRLRGDHAPAKSQGANNDSSRPHRALARFSRGKMMARCHKTLFEKNIV